MPQTSIVIRALNEGKHIGNLLAKLSTQSYQDFEVVLVDNGSTDGTLDIIKDYDVNLVEIERTDFTFGYALNVGCEAAKGDYLVFVSAHVLPENDDWLKNLVEPFVDEKVAMTFGRQLGAPTTKFSEKQDFFRIFGKRKQGSNIKDYYANNANSAIRKSLWKKYKFDEYLFGLEDIDWSRHFYKEGYKTMYVPSAPIFHIHDEIWPQVFNRYRREAIAAVRIGLKVPPQVSLSFIWIFIQLARDLVATFPNYSPKRLNEILKFRYYSFKGSRIGFKQGNSINFDTELKDLMQVEENKAVVIKDKNRAVLETVELPELTPKDVVVRVEYVGVCKTDIEVYDGTLGYYAEGVASYPITPGHEFVGRVAKIGSNNKYQERYNVGDRVVGECILSRADDSREEVGVINRNGGYANFVVMPGSGLQKVPDNVDSKDAVFAEPLGVVLRAIRRIEHRLFDGAKIAVTGAGQIGNLSAQALAHRGFEVDVFDTSEERLKHVEKSVNDTDTKLQNLARYDVIIEATGNLDVLKKVLRGSTVDATLLLLGFPYGDMEYNFEKIVGKEKVIVGSVGADGEDFQSALKLIPELNMEPFTRRVLPLSEFASAWKDQRNNKYFKIILEP